MIDKIKALVLWVKAQAISFFQSDFIQQWYSNFQSIRAIWNWVYMALYCWCCIFAMLHYPNASETVIKVTGGIVSVIFTGYVASKSYERVNGVKPPEDQ
jgi:hypothetical protein